MFSVRCCLIKLPRIERVMGPIIGPVNLQRRTMSMFSRSVRFLFKKNLLLTNSVTSGGFMAIGDLIQQEVEYRSKKIPERYDWARAGTLAL